MQLFKVIVDRRSSDGHTHADSHPIIIKAQVKSMAQVSYKCMCLPSMVIIA